jgi:hypothetical protein
MRCKRCGENLIKKGRRKTKYQAKQRYYCNNCRIYISASKDFFANKTYPAKAIVAAISYYNLGHTLKETSKEINRRFKLKSSPSTVHSWITEFRDICTFSKIRKGIVKKNGPLEGQTITKDFHHSGLTYTMKIHRPKLLMKTRDFPGIRSYLFWLENNSPDKYFEDGQRSSTMKADINVKTKGLFNKACQMASLALKAAKNNRERHSVVEDFFLVNDLSTIAVEIPVWYWDKRIGGISGHVDILQVRNRKVYVLDYKPQAKKQKHALTQLYSYALALSFRAKIPLKSICCGYFDEETYIEFPAGSVKAG